MVGKEMMMLSARDRLKQGILISLTSLFVVQSVTLLALLYIHAEDFSQNEWVIWISFMSFIVSLKMFMVKMVNSFIDKIFGSLQDTKSTKVKVVGCTPSTMYVVVNVLVTTALLLVLMLGINRLLATSVGDRYTFEMSVTDKKATNERFIVVEDRLDDVEGNMCR